MPNWAKLFGLIIKEGAPEVVKIIRMQRAQMRLVAYQEISEQGRKEIAEMIEKMPMPKVEEHKPAPSSSDLVRVATAFQAANHDESCPRCTVKHLGIAKIFLEEALATDPSSERFTKKVRDAMNQMGMAEAVHLNKWPEFATKVRDTRKEMEKTVFDKAPLQIMPGHIESLIDEAFALPETEHHKHEVSENATTPEVSG